MGLNPMSLGLKSNKFYLNDVSSQMNFDVFLSNETQFLIFNSGKKKSNENKINESNDNYEEEREDGKDIFFKKYFVTNEFYSQMSVK